MNNAGCDVRYPLSLGYLARVQRCQRRLSRRALAVKACVSVRDVARIESDGQLPSETKRRLLGELWSGRANIL